MLGIPGLGCLYDMVGLICDEMQLLLLVVTVPGLGNGLHGKVELMCDEMQKRLLL